MALQPFVEKKTSDPQKKGSETTKDLISLQTHSQHSQKTKDKTQVPETRLGLDSLCLHSGLSLDVIYA